MGTSQPRARSPATMCSKFAASFTVGAVIRTISQPTSTSASVCSRQAAVSIVSQVSMDWTRIG